MSFPLIYSIAGIGCSFDSVLLENPFEIGYEFRSDLVLLDLSFRLISYCGNFLLTLN